MVLSNPVPSQIFPEFFPDFLDQRDQKTLVFSRYCQFGKRPPVSSCLEKKARERRPLYKTKNSLLQDMFLELILYKTSLGGKTRTESMCKVQLGNKKILKNCQNKNCIEDAVMALGRPKEPHLQSPPPFTKSWHSFINMSRQDLFHSAFSAIMNLFNKTLLVL